MTYCQDPKLLNTVQRGMQLHDVHAAEYLSYVKVFFNLGFVYHHEHLSRKTKTGVSYAAVCRGGDCSMWPEVILCKRKHFHTKTGMFSLHLKVFDLNCLRHCTAPHEALQHFQTV